MRGNRDREGVGGCLIVRVYAGDCGMGSWYGAGRWRCDSSLNGVKKVV